MELKLTPRFLQNGQRFFGPGVAELLARARVDTLLLPDVSDDAGARFRVKNHCGYLWRVWPSRRRCVPDA